MKEFIKDLESTISMAETWCKKQLLPEGLICMSALKDLRRKIRKQKEK